LEFEPLLETKNVLPVEAGRPPGRDSRPEAADARAIAPSDVEDPAPDTNTKGAKSAPVRAAFLTRPPFTVGRPYTPPCVEVASGSG
jgi:hypothetical protein